MKKILCNFISILMLCIFLSPIAFAETVYSTKTVDEVTTNSEINKDDENKESNILPSVSVDNAISWVNRKGSQFVSIFQAIGSKLCIFGFIICAIIAIFGKTSEGLFGMLISAFAFICILYAPQILQIIKNITLS